MAEDIKTLDDLKEVVGGTSAETPSAAEPVRERG